MRFVVILLVNDKILLSLLSGKQTFASPAPLFRIMYLFILKPFKILNPQHRNSLGRTAVTAPTFPGKDGTFLDASDRGQTPVPLFGLWLPHLDERLHFVFPFCYCSGFEGNLWTLEGARW